MVQNIPVLPFNQKPHVFHRNKIHLDVIKRKENNSSPMYHSEKCAEFNFVFKLNFRDETVFWNKHT